MESCPAFDPTGPYVSTLLGWADCRALALGADGYAALGPGSAFGALLTGLLTIVVALVGYRLLLGGRLVLREGVLLAIRLGGVLALAGQWPAYRTVIYESFTTGPAALAGVLVGAAGLGGPAVSGLAARVDGVDAAIADLIQPQPVAAASRPGLLPPRALPDAAQRPVETGGELLTLTVLAGWLATRVVSGVLLALGPLFLASLLFPFTQGLFIGWLRGLIGAGLGAVAACLVVALELAVIEPQVLALRALIDLGQPAGILPVAIAATGTVFAMVMLAALLAVARVAAGLRLPEALAAVAPPPAGPADAGMGPSSAFARPDHARAVAGAMARLDRREQGAALSDTRLMRLAYMDPAVAAQADPAVPLPLGQSARRLTLRPSAAAARRDELT